MGQVWKQIMLLDCEAHEVPKQTPESHHDVVLIISCK